MHKSSRNVRLRDVFWCRRRPFRKFWCHFEKFGYCEKEVEAPFSKIGALQKIIWTTLLNRPENGGLGSR